MAKKNPFDKEQTTKIPFSELVELIGTSCDYKFCIIDENIDEELMSLAASHGICKWQIKNQQFFVINFHQFFVISFHQLYIVLRKSAVEAEAA